LYDAINQSSVIAGFVAEGERSGFCMLSKDALGEHKEPESMVKAIA